MQHISEIEKGKDVTDMNRTELKWFDKKLKIEHHVAKFKGGMNFFSLYVVSNNVMLGKTGQNYWLLEYDGEDQNFEDIDDSLIETPRDELKEMLDNGVIKEEKFEAILESKD